MKRTTNLAIVAIVLCTLGLAGTKAVAAPIIFTLDAEDFNNLGVTGAASALVAQAYNYGGTFTGCVTSQAFALDTGEYLYLYQADNYGPSSLEVFAIFPFAGFNPTNGALGRGEAGYLTANEPAGFLPGGYVPAGQTYDDVPAVLVVSFQFPTFLAAHVPAGGHTASLYLVSPYGPTMGEAHVIDGGTAGVDVVVPVPEPGSLALLAIGAVALIRRRRR